MGIEKVLETPLGFKGQKMFYEKFKKATYLFISEEAIVKQIETTAANENKKG